jgi:hypothetical protein
VVLLSLLLILAPLGLGALRTREGATPVQHGDRLLSRAIAPAYFACIGLGFVLLEVWLLHRFSMFLGHQVYSLSVVLATLLLSTGLGAWLGERLGLTASRRAILGPLTAVVMLGAALLALPAVLEATWASSLATRVAVAAACVVPLGIVLGQPFVAALTRLRAHAPSAVPWCIGINAFASVIASVSAVPLAMALGYRALALPALALNAGACALGALLRERRP